MKIRHEAAAFGIGVVPFMISLGIVAHVSHENDSSATARQDSVASQPDTSAHAQAQGADFNTGSDFSKFQLPASYEGPSDDRTNDILWGGVIASFGTWCVASWKLGKREDLTALNAEIAGISDISEIPVQASNQEAGIEL